MNDNKKKQGQAATLKKVFRHLGKYRIFVVFSILLATVSVALTLYVPKLTGNAVDYIIGAGNVDFPGGDPDYDPDRSMYSDYSAGPVADEYMQ